MTIGRSRNLNRFWADHIIPATKRLAEARKIAESLRHNKRMHRLAMEVVFLLEDTLAKLTEVSLLNEEPRDRFR